jgi:hypothetical protein
MLVSGCTVSFRIIARRFRSLVTRLMIVLEVLSYGTLLVLVGLGSAQIEF